MGNWVATSNEGTLVFHPNIPLRPCLEHDADALIFPIPLLDQSPCQCLHTSICGHIAMLQGGPISILTPLLHPGDGQVWTQRGSHICVSFPQSLSPHN